MAPPKPIINNIEVYDCAGGDCSYYIYYDPAPVGTEVTVYLDGRHVEHGDAEVGRIDVTSAEGVQVSVQVAFYTGAGPTLEETLSDAVLFTPQTKLPTPIPKIATLETDFVDISWDAVPISGCNPDPGDKILYSVWFDGNKQADRESTHADFDDLSPGSSHTVEVQAMPLADWDCSPSDRASIEFTTPRSLDGVLHIMTAPEGALVQVDGVHKGGTNMVYLHSLPAGETRERVACKLTLDHFKDKTFNKTLRSGLHEYALYRLSPFHKIKGKTSKDRVANAATFTFTIFERGRTGTQVYKAGIALTLLNQYTGQIRELITDASGVTKVTIPYDDDFFTSGKNKLVCVMDNTADRIRTFRTITVSKILVSNISIESIGAEEDWHDEDDDTDSITDSAANSIDAAYAKI